MNFNLVSFMRVRYKILKRRIATTGGGVVNFAEVRMKSCVAFRNFIAENIDIFSKGISEI